VHQQDAYTTNAGEGAVTIRFNTLAPLSICWLYASI